MLYEADAYNETGAFGRDGSSPYFRNLVENVRRLELDVERVVPVHYPLDNRVITMADVMRLMSKHARN